MSDYVQIEFPGISPEKNDLLIAALSDTDFEGFEEGENNVKAFIKASAFEKGRVEKIARQYEVNFTVSIIRETNWNKVWESNFQPVIVDDFCGIRTDFHESILNVEHEIIITPKMSFGTGHHPTTFMMIRQMREIDFPGKTVFDFGTGTGILAILAKKSGALNVVAVDNDDWSIENAKENFQKNNCSEIFLQKANFPPVADSEFDVVLANIDKNVIVENFSLLVKQLNDGGILILSGLLSEDEKDILEEAKNYPLVPDKKLEQHGWISLRFYLKN
jgi:ribosomal protein L11 methyltransferase